MQQNSPGAPKKRINSINLVSFYETTSLTNSIKDMC